MKKHIVCFGDSNTHGCCADPADCADGGRRFNEEERWTCLLQKALGEEYLVLEEGMGGRTCVFEDPTYEGRCGIESIVTTMETHKPVDLLILMLGTNDCKERFSADAFTISMGLELLIEKAKSVDCWAGGTPNILVIAPPPIREEMLTSDMAESMGAGAIEKSRGLARKFAFVSVSAGCRFLDARGIAEMNPVDGMHLTARGHQALAETLAQLVPTLL